MHLGSNEVEIPSVKSLQVNLPRWVANLIDCKLFINVHGKLCSKAMRLRRLQILVEIGPAIRI